MLHLYIRESLRHRHRCAARIFEHTLIGLDVLLVLVVFVGQAAADPILATKDTYLSSKYNAHTVKNYGRNSTLVTNQTNKFA